MMKKTIVLFAFLISLTTAKAQLEVTTPNTIFVPNPDTASSIKRFRLEKIPCFPGGFDRLNNYLKNNLIYPEKALKNHIEGTVFVSFTVDTDGSLMNIKTDSDLSPEMVAEAIRLIKKSPKWTPAMAGGYPIKFGYFWPVVFKIK